MKELAPKAILFCNGELRKSSRLDMLELSHAYLVGVDGGTHHIRQLGLQPDLIIGDLDSISSEILTEMKTGNVEIVRFPVEKDETDLELALERVAALGFRDITIVAALGGRLDQMLGNLMLITSPSLADCRVEVVDGGEKVVVVRNKLHLKGRKGDIVSLISVGGAAYGIYTEGLRYPLDGEILYMEKSRGLSNEMTGEDAMVRVEEGLLLCIHTAKED